MKLITVLSLIMAFALTSCGSSDKKKKSEPQAAQVKTMSPEQVQAHTASWPEKHKQIIQNLTAKYGQPNEATSNMLIWLDNGPWIRTVVNRDDMTNPLSQTASLDVPPEKLGDVALFNRSVVVNAQENKVTSAADKEDLNFLALNLTKEIVDGGMSPMEARRQYGQLADVTQKTNLMDGLKFKGGDQQSTLEAQEAEEAAQ